MNNFDNLKDILEMAELLDSELENSLEVVTVNADDTSSVRVVFVFDDDKNLIGIYTEN